jgi:serine protease Do
MNEGPRRTSCVGRLLLLCSIFVHGLAWGAGGINGAACTCPDFSALVKELSQSVVNVSVDGDSGSRDLAKEEGPKDKDDGAEGDSMPRSAGSGFVIDSSGYIVTNNHVVGAAVAAVVRLPDDRTEYTAKVVGKDPKTDLALLKIEPRAELKAVRFGDSDEIEVGAWVMAIGNQFQLGQTVTAGIVSAKSRKVPSRAGPYDSFIQTDASINPGSSGGPLFNIKGEVVGINSAIFSPGRGPQGGSGFNIGIGFSIPANTARSVIQQLKENGRVVRGLLGVMIQPIDTAMVEALGLRSQDGALVADIIPKTPAVAAGFKRLDVITKFGGHPIRDFDDLPLVVASTPIGATVEVEVTRAGKTKFLRVTVEELKDLAAERQTTTVSYNSWGLALENISPELGRSLGMQSTTGVLVTAVKEDSLGARAGFRRGDVIEEVQGVVTPEISTLERVIVGSPPNKPQLVVVRRKEGIRVLSVKSSK